MICNWIKTILKLKIIIIHNPLDKRTTFMNNEEEKNVWIVSGSLLAAKIQFILFIIHFILQNFQNFPISMIWFTLLIIFYSFSVSFLSQTILFVDVAMNHCSPISSRSVFFCVVFLLFFTNGFSITEHLYFFANHFFK